MAWVIVSVVVDIVDERDGKEVSERSAYKYHMGVSAACVSVDAIRREDLVAIVSDHGVMRDLSIAYGER